jgi:hypothetical protein
MVQFFLLFLGIGLAGYAALLSAVARFNSGF